MELHNRTLNQKLTLMGNICTLEGISWDVLFYICIERAIFIIFYVKFEHLINELIKSIYQPEYCILLPIQFDQHKQKPSLNWQSGRPTKACHDSRH